MVLFMSDNARRSFAVGNLFIATILAIFELTLPLRQWIVDVPIALVVLTLVASAIAALLKPQTSEAWLRAAAMALLAFGLLFLAMAVLTLAFLAGIHGVLLGRDLRTVCLVLAVGGPYVLGYPLLVLNWPRPSKSS